MGYAAAYPLGVLGIILSMILIKVFFRISLENEQKDDASSESSLGGSAPVTITFTAYCTDAMAHAEWQMARDAEFADIDSRFAQDEITQTFNEGGTFYYRFYGADSSGECETTSETYTITIGESVLECPNAFSPQGSDGNFTETANS